MTGSGTYVGSCQDCFGEREEESAKCMNWRLKDVMIEYYVMYESRCLRAVFLFCDRVLGHLLPLFAPFYCSSSHCLVSSISRLPFSFLFLTHVHNVTIKVILDIDTPRFPPVVHLTSLLTTLRIS